MKKIVSIIGAALLASSIFAVDIASMMQINGDLLNYDGENFKVLQAKDWDPSGDSDYSFKFSVDAGDAGAEFWSWSATDAIAYSSYKLWFKPADILKITVGNVGGGTVSNPQFDWWAHTVENYSYGYQAELFPVDGLSFKLALQPGKGEYFIDGTKDGFDSIGNFWFDATYGADFGSIQFIATKGATVGAHGFSGWASSPFALAVAYANLPYLQNGYYADAAISFKDGADGLEFQGIDSQIGGQFGVDAFLIQLTNLIQYRDEFKYGFSLKARYGLGSFTPWLEIDGYDITNDPASFTIRPGVDTSVGACSITAEISIPVTLSDTYKFGFSVPLTFEIHF